MQANPLRLINFVGCADAQTSLTLLVGHKCGILHMYKCINISHITVHIRKTPADPLRLINFASE